MAIAAIPKLRAGAGADLVSYAPIGYRAAMAAAAIPNEPVRGYIPPAWFSGLSGLEQMRAWSTGLLPAPPATRLTGSRCTHVGPGLATCVMPASEMLVTEDDRLEIWPLAGDALGSALHTVVGPGQIATPLVMSVNYFRPARVGTGNLVARARVLNASKDIAYAEALIEDNDGRQLACCGGQAAIITLEPKPPQPPSLIEHIEEPTWATPDPWQRPPGANVSLPPPELIGGKELIEELAGGHLRTPLGSLLGLAILDLDDNNLAATMPASEWFCTHSRIVSAGIVAAMANTLGWWSGFKRRRAGESAAGLEMVMRSFRSVPADGRPIRAEARRIHLGDNGVGNMQVTVYDADDQIVAICTGTALIKDGVRGKRATRRPSERALCTLLFTDIVGSTQQAESLGDAAWKSLREQHDEIARRQIAFCAGLLIKNMGDGLLARFGSPARAIDCASRLRNSLAPLGLQIRSGLHTGECEITEDDVIGAAVNLAARIQGAAAPGEILVSSTVKDLTTGANLQFEDRGQQQLKGFEEPWRLWAVKA